MLSPHLLGSVLESAPDAVVVTDAHSGRILFANRQVRAVFGYEPDDLIDQSIEQLLPERFGACHVHHRRDYMRNLRTRPMGAGLDLFARRKDGSEFPVEISLSPIQDGERSLVAAAIRDVTERKKAQEEVIAARELAERANVAKSRFLAAASHDLRQPLQSLALLNGTLQTLSTRPNAQRAVAQQAQAIDAMSRLLNALLDISKLESGAVKPEPEDFVVVSILEDLRAEFAALASQKGLKLRVEAEPLSVHADPGLVGQMLRNLLANAIKYTRQGAVFLRSIPKAGSVRIEVLDTGIGIPTDQLPFIYDEFFQVGVDVHTPREGYGLGLSIVSRLADLLGVQLEVRSREKVGSCFAFELPRARTVVVRRLSDSGTFPVHDARAAGRHILLVEDDMAVREAMECFLTVTGYRVSTAASLKVAERHARENPDVELLITDYHLGEGETGSQVITAVREARGPNLPVVLVTGDTSCAIRELPQDERLRIVSKPIKAKELLRLIQGLVA